MADLDPIVAALRDEREARNWTRKKVAAVAGLGVNTISKVELGGGGVTLATLRVWSGALDCDLTLTRRPRR